MKSIITAILVASSAISFAASLNADFSITNEIQTEHGATATKPFQPAASQLSVTLARSQ